MRLRRLDLANGSPPAVPLYDNIIMQIPIYTAADTLICICVSMMFNPLKYYHTRFLIGFHRSRKL